MVKNPTDNNVKLYTQYNGWTLTPQNSWW